LLNKHIIILFGLFKRATFCKGRIKTEHNSISYCGHKAYVIIEVQCVLNLCRYLFQLQTGQSHSLNLKIDLYRGILKKSTYCQTTINNVRLEGRHCAVGFGSTVSDSNSG
jgi:hypothetical protein